MDKLSQRRSTKGEKEPAKKEVEKKREKRGKSGEKKSGKKMLTKGAMSDIIKKLAKSGHASGRGRI